MTDEETTDRWKNAGWRVNLRWSIQPYAGVFVKVCSPNRPRPRGWCATRHR